MTSAVFSVIVPTYNRIPLLQQTLESLFRQDYSNYEIIVVSDGSNDGTDEYLARLQERARIKFLRQENQGPAIARNRGIDCAQGKYVAFTDDDCVVPTDWLSRFCRKFQEDDAIAGIGGVAETGDTRNLCAAANDMIVNFLKKNLNVASGASIFLTSNNAAYKKSSLEKIGGFYKGFRIGAEERDLNFRLEQAQELLVYDPTQIVLHKNDATLFQFLRHQYDQGKGSFLFYQHARVNFGRRPPLIPLRVYLGLLVHPFRSRRIGDALILAMLVLLAQMAVTVGYIVAKFSSFDVSTLEKVH